MDGRTVHSAKWPQVRCGRDWAIERCNYLLEVRKYPDKLEETGIERALTQGLHCPEDFHVHETMEVLKPSSDVPIRNDSWKIPVVMLPALREMKHLYWYLMAAET